jgi:hypothetical protein
MLARCLVGESLLSLHCRCNVACMCEVSSEVICGSKKGRGANQVSTLGALSPFAAFRTETHRVAVTKITHSHWKKDQTKGSRDGVAVPCVDRERGHSLISSQPKP